MSNLKEITKSYSSNNFLNKIITTISPKIKETPFHKFFLKLFKSSQKQITFGSKSLTLEPFTNTNIKYTIKNTKTSNHGAYSTIYQTNSNSIIFKKTKFSEEEFKRLIFHYLLQEYYKNNNDSKYLCKLLEFGSIMNQRGYTDFYYSYMEKCGIDLKNTLNKLNKSSKNFNKLFTYFYNCCKSLLLLHNLEYLHLDIKLENFLCIKNQIKIIDFGFVEKNNYETNIIFGTPHYISCDWVNNVIQKNPTTLTYVHDIFSLGIMFIEMLYLIILNERIFIACPIIKHKEYSELGLKKTDIDDFIYTIRSNYYYYSLNIKNKNNENYKYTYDFMITTIKNDLYNNFNIKNDLYNNFNIKNSKTKEIIGNINLSILLIEKMCHPDPNQRCNDVKKIINILDVFLYKNITIRNNNIVVRIEE